MKHFPLPDDYGVTSVPNAVLDALVDPEAFVDQITFAWRTLWWLERSTTFPKSVTVSDLRTDRTLIRTIGPAFDSVMGAICERGIFIRTGNDSDDRLMLNTVAATRGGGNVNDRCDDDATNGWDSVARPTGPADAFRAYEQNIGQLTPMIRESIGQSLQDFTDAQITQAIRIAVENDARSWAFIKAVLKRWNREGIPDEQEPRRDTGRFGFPEAELERYLERARTK